MNNDFEIFGYSKDGILWVHFSETRLEESYKFRYQKGDLYLIGATSSRWWPKIFFKAAKRI